MDLEVALYCLFESQLVGIHITLLARWRFIAYDLSHFEEQVHSKFICNRVTSNEESDATKKDTKQLQRK